MVRLGPHRWSRDPIYLAFSLFQLGLALSTNSVWLLVMLVPAPALMTFVVIPREERYLETRFPSDYLAYKVLCVDGCKQAAASGAPRSEFSIRHSPRCSYYPSRGGRGGD